MHAGIGRGVGVTEFLHGGADVAAIALFALLTQLGDVWFLFALGSALYVAGTVLPGSSVDRRRGLFVLALVFAYVALVGAVKAVFGLPRPPGAADAPAVAWLPSVLAAVFESAATGTGPGFPSGHALGTTMVWGGTALVHDGLCDRVRFGVAGVVVAVVATSRLVLGVHYTVDVLAGVGLGLAVLWVCYRLAAGGVAPGRVLAVAVAAGAAGLVLDGSGESVAAAGAAVGAWLAWRAVAGATPDRSVTRRATLVGALVLIPVGGLFGALYVLGPPAPIAFAGAAVAGGGVVAAPALGDRLT
jgi:membrane-associated phospholipid phosphatase